MSIIRLINKLYIVTMKKSKELSESKQLDAEFLSVKNVTMSEREMILHDEFSQALNLGNNIVGVTDKALDVWNESQRIKQNIAAIEAVKEVELQKIVAKFELCKEMLTQTFGQRQQGLNVHYKMLDQALASNDRTLIIESLRGISTIVASNPLEDFTKFIEAWDDKEKPLELDF